MISERRDRCVGGIRHGSAKGPVRTSPQAFQIYGGEVFEGARPCSVTLLLHTAALRDDMRQPKSRPTLVVNRFKKSAKWSYQSPSRFQLSTDYKSLQNSLTIVQADASRQPVQKFKLMSKVMPFNVLAEAEGQLSAEAHCHRKDTKRMFRLAVQ